MLVIITKKVKNLLYSDLDLIVSVAKVIQNLKILFFKEMISLVVHSTFLISVRVELLNVRDAK